MLEYRRIAVLIGLDFTHGRRVLQGVRSYATPEKRWELHRYNPDVRTIKSLANWKPHGIIAHLASPAMVRAVRRLGKPVINTSARAITPDIMFVGSGWIAATAVDHFLERGFRNFAFFGRKGQAEPIQEMYRRLLKAAGYGCSVLVPADQMLEDRYYSAAGFTGRWSPWETETRRWLMGLLKPVAILAYNDHGARRVADVCRRAGIQVPEEVAILGTDNDEAVCEWAYPPLSSVRLASEKIGYESARNLDRLMSKRKPKGMVLAIPPTSVVVRRSTDVVAIDDHDLVGALRYIRENADKAVGVDWVVAKTAVCRRRLEQKFQKCLGRTILAEITRVHVNRARSLLAETNLPVLDVGLASGFASPQYFSTVFRRQVGMTPSDYRKQYRDS